MLSTILTCVMDHWCVTCFNRGGETWHEYLAIKKMMSEPIAFLVLSIRPQDTGALKGLYGASEMKSDHAKDRDSKMKYIEKAVFCVSFAVGEALSVKPGKVVAGQEPEKTNEFLQMLARVVKEKIDTKEHVKRVLNGMTITETSSQGYL